MVEHTVQVHFKWIGNVHFCASQSQRAKEVVSDSPGLVDFATGLVNSVLNLSDEQVKFCEEFKL